MKSRSPHSADHNTGFTIVETMIVLAIAGLILLIVFAAIPALARSSRNNQRRQDVATILRAVSQYELKDSGNFPLACGPGQPHLCTDSAGSPNINDYFLQPPVSNKLIYYQPTNISLTQQTTAPGGRINRIGFANTEVIRIYNYEKCATFPVGSATITGAGYDDVVAMYTLETGNSLHSAQCQQL